MDAIWCFLPIGCLVVVTVSRRARMPSVRSLPLAAGLMWFVRLVYLSSPPNQLNAAVSNRKSRPDRS